MAIPQPVRRTQVVTDTKQLTVSTVRIRADYYDTVVFDDSKGKRHSGWTIGGFVIDKQSRRAATRDEALEQHHDAVDAAYAEEPQPITEQVPGGEPGE
ncbi:hypothetical protein [Streptomyces sp. 184]|uniref:hypothetical protein n=1 Tax=Streptomyces sp. 184 TaxID=1827526 RepID=UPI0038913724